MLHFEKFEREEPSPWLVFVHGAGGSIKTWQYQVDHFRPYFNVLLVDLRDHGRSKGLLPHFDQYTFKIISSDLKQVLDQVGILEAYFLTLSFGSVLIQDFNKRYPEQVKGLVFCGAIFKGNFLIRTFVHLARFMNLFLPYEKMYTLFSYLLMPRKRNQLARRVYQLQSRKLTQKEYFRWIGLYGEFFRLLRDFYHQKLMVKSLIVMGGDDFVFLRAARTFARNQPYCELRVIDKAGHVCNIDAPGEFNEIALSFILDEQS